MAGEDIGDAAILMPVQNLSGSDNTKTNVL